MEPAVPLEDEGPPMAVILVPAATMIVAPLLVLAGWDLSGAVTAFVGAVTAGWCFYRKVYTLLTLMGWNTAIMVWAGYDLLM